MESDVITLQDIFEFKLESIGFDRTITGGLQPTGLRPVVLQKFEKRGIELPTDLFVQPHATDGAGVKAVR